MEIDGKSWFFKNVAAARNLTRQAYKNYNMFYNPIFLHSRPILTLENPDKSTKVQETLGTIELEKTFLPENVAAQVKHFLVLDLRSIKYFINLSRTRALIIRRVSVVGNH